MYRMAFLKKSGPRHFPVEGCSGRAATQTAMRVDFWNRHVQETVVILEEGTPLHPKSPLCNMLVPWRSLNVSQKSKAQYKKVADQKRWSLAAEEARKVALREFIVYRCSLKIFPSFEYMGRVI